MWGRLATCGRVALGLPTSVQMPTRPSTTRPQDTILPHITALSRREDGGEIQGGGQNAGDGVRLVVEDELTGEGGGVGSESGFPETVDQQDGL
jgi:hypothetical protein